MSRLSLDDAAWTNRWTRRHVGEKALLALGLLGVASTATPPVAIVAGAMAMGAALIGAAVPARTWLRAVFAPASFAAVGLLGVVITLDTAMGQVLWSWGPFAVTDLTWERGTEVAARSIGSICAAMLLATTTPMTSLLQGLGRLRFPASFIEIAALVYRLLFNLLDTQSRIRDAQTRRLGYRSTATAYRSLGLLGSAVLLRSWTHALRLEAGLAGRGYDGTLRTLPATAKLDLVFVSASTALVSTLLVASLVVR